MRWFIASVAGVLLVVLIASGAQTLRYLGIRRDVVQDLQPLLYSGDSFHTVTLVKLSPDQPLLSGVGELSTTIEDLGGKVVYAGKIAVNALQSKQLPQIDWDAFVLSQHTDRAAYEAARANPDYEQAYSSFAHAFTLGMDRPVGFNLAVPTILLGKRVSDLISGQAPRHPFERAETSTAGPQGLERESEIVEKLLANRIYGAEACVVLNFIKAGADSEKAANADYGAAMIGLLAEVGGGPMHFGRAITLEGDAEFDQVIIVYYPGVEFFADMVRSQFFTGIVGGKQLGDTLSAPSVPLLPHL